MGKLIFLTGGVRSGKSDHAERMAARYEDVAYIATAISTDAEMRRRIDKHQQRRPRTWKTCEAPYDIAGAVRERKHEAYLIDCITVYITNLLLREKTDWDGTDVLDRGEQEALERKIEKKIRELLAEISKSDAVFIVVSNEVGMGLVPAYSLGRLFRDAAGMANRMIADAADEVYLSVSGILLPLKKDENGGKQ